MTGEVSGKDQPKLRVVRLDRLNNEEPRSGKSVQPILSNSPLKAAEQAVSVTFSANAASKSTIERVAQFVGSPLQREVSVAMEQAARNRKEDVDSLARRVAEEVLDNPEGALGAISLDGRSIEVLKGTSTTR